MNGYLDDLAWAAADALVSVMMTDSWETVKHRFAVVVGHERRMDASRAEIVATSGPDRRHAQQAQTRAWSTRLQDLLDDNPGAAQGLRLLLADLDAASFWAAPTSQHAQASHASQAVNIGGGISDNSGEVYVGVGKVDKRKSNLGLAPFMFVIGSAKKAAVAHPIVATVTTAVVVLGAAAGAGWHAHWPTAVFGAAVPAGGISNSSQAAQVFGDSYSRWQLRVPDPASAAGLVTFSYGLVLVAEGSSPATQVTAYRETTGAQVWSRAFPSGPVAAGNLLLTLTYSTTLTAYHSMAAPSRLCPSAISRINPATGQTVWTSSVVDALCQQPSATAAYVVCGSTILSAADGATLQQLPSESQGWAFGSDILVQDGSALSLDKLRAGRLQPLWQRNIAVGYTVWAAPPQIVLSRQDYNSSLARFILLNPVSGATVKSITALGLLITPDGVDVLSPAGRMLFLSASRVKTGPEFSSVLFSGGILWSYRSPNGYSTGPVYANAIDPESFKVLGRLVTTRSEVGAEGNDSYVLSDGKYAAIVAAPVIYVFKL
jgi:outer membrane protein assembly factor BamB